MKKYSSSLLFWFATVYLNITFLSTSPLLAKELIVAIGDSITQADTHWTVQGHKNTIQGGWVTRLESILNENFPDEDEVINKGAGIREQILKKVRTCGNLMVVCVKEDDLMAEGRGSVYPNMPVQVVQNVQKCR